MLRLIKYLVLFVIALALIVVAMANRGPMTLRLLPEGLMSAERAEAMGVNLRRLRVELIGVSSVLAAGAVVLAGPIAFVGVVWPLLARVRLGPSHRGLLWSSAVLGAALGGLADTVGAALARALGVGVVPLGVFTAIVGGVAFLWMLRPHLGRGVE